MFFALSFFSFASVTTIELFSNERRLVAREVRGGYYSALAYLLTKGPSPAYLHTSHTAS